MKDPEHDEESRVVEDRADGADEENEPLDLTDVPGPRPRHLLFVHRVGRDRHLREVVQQVVGQHLDRGHRQEGKEGARPQHAEHVAEVGTRPHPDVFEDVGEDLSALDHAPFQHHQVLLQQDQIRRLLGDVGGRVHRDADVRGAQGGSVVDSVAHESDDVPLAPQDADDPLLVRGREAGEQRRLLRRLGQFGVGHLLHVAAQQHRVGGEAHVLAHLAADELVVPGEDFYRHAMLVQRLDGASRGVLGRVQECDVSFEHEVALVILRADLLSRQLLCCHRQNPEAIVAEARRTLPSARRSGRGPWATTLPSSSK